MSSSRKEAVEASGGTSVVARRIGVTDQRVSNWIERGVPDRFCARFERAVEGRWMRWDECPGEWRDIWPELADRPGAPAIASSAPSVEVETA